MGHVLLDNRHGLVAGACLTAATGTAERGAALGLLASLPERDITVGTDKAYDQRAFVATSRALGATTHVAQKVRGSAIDARTTRHASYAISQRKRKLVEQVFGWMKPGDCSGKSTIAAADSWSGSSALPRRPTM